MLSRPPVIWFDRIDSTNAEARRRAGSGDFGPVWLSAKEQYAGRGRLERPWSSPGGNLAATGLYPNTRTFAQTVLLTHVAALAVRDLLSTLCTGKVEIKWPNDVLLDGQKLAGILLESGGQNRWICMGIGINLKAHPDSGTRIKASHVGAHLRHPGTDISPETVLDALIERVHHWMAVLDGTGFGPVRESWMASAWGIGDVTLVTQGQDRIEARLIGLTESGGMEAELDNGRRIVITAGDILMPGER